MNREIKFRAWDKTSGKMCNDISSIDFTDDGKIAQINVVTGVDILFPDKEAFLMQYTGLKDKNGVEIYEGDIMRYRDDENAKIVEVIWKPEYARFDMVNGSWSEYLWAINWPVSTSEVIGNIYENKELLNAS